MFALLILLFLVGGYLAFFLVPAINQGTFEALLVVTSNWNEIALIIIGLAMICIAVVSMTKGREDWTIKDNSGRRAVRGCLPETNDDARIFLRDVLLKKVRLVKNLTLDELDGMPRADLVSMIHDDELSRLLDDDCENMSKDEIRRLMRKIERWE